MVCPLLHMDRRQFLLLLGLLPHGLTRAAQVHDRERVQKLVALLVDSPRDRILPALLTALRTGTSREELLAALALAAVQQIEPYPSVGFKYHAFMMLSSLHETVIHSPSDERCLPLLWAADVFKGAQQRALYNGDWSLSPVSGNLPPAAQSSAAFNHAMSNWDAEAADAAIASLVRAAPARHIFEHLFAYAARDFRAIGHKAITISNSHRLLRTIGWQYAEPLLRSTVYALQNHEGEPDPSQSDLFADRPWRSNLAHAQRFPNHWQKGKVDHQATFAVLAALRREPYDDISRQAVELLQQGVDPAMLWDAAILAAGELVMRSSGILSVHANTSIDALYYAYGQTSGDHNRRMLLLQGLSWITLFRDQLGSNTRRLTIESLQPRPPTAGADDALVEIFEDVSSNRLLAAQKVLHLLGAGGPAQHFLAMGRRYTVWHNTGYHDYKFTEAAFANGRRLSPQWRARYLSASVFYLNGSRDKLNPVVAQARDLLGQSGHCEP